MGVQLTSVSRNRKSKEHWASQRPLPIHATQSFAEFLALGPAKGAGLGRQVMAVAEAEARRRGMLGVWLDTWTFQAPDFYLKLGFVEFGRITDYPPGHDRIFYVKRLSPDASGR